MEHNQYILQVPNPCKEDWHQMAPDQNGRFCVHCSKAVIDFTMLTDEQIIDLVEKQQGKLCGRLTSSQLKRAIETPQQPAYQRGRFKEIIAALLLLFTSKEIIAGKPKAEKIIAIQQPSAFVVAKSNTDNKDSAGVGELTGVVLDKNNGEPLQGAIIMNNTRHIGQTADSLGRFKIAASIGDNITVQYIGFESNTFVVHNMENKDCRLYMSEYVLGGMEPIVVYQKKHALLYKIRHFFHLKYKPKHSAT